MSVQKRHRMLSVKVAVSMLAIAFLPVVVSAASTSANTIINASIDAVISMTTASPVTVSLTPTPGGVVSSSSDTVSVSTNNSTGYTLTLADNDTDTNLVNGANNIAAHAGTQASPTALANNTWGYRVDGVGGFGAGPTSAEANNGSSSTLWAGMPSSASPNTLKTTSSTATNDTTTVWYGVRVNTSLPSGTYTDTVTYTATTN
jgi:hypothetical protein